METPQFAPRRIVLRLRPNTTPDEVRALIAGNEHEVVMESMMRPPRRIIVVLVPEGTEEEWLARYVADQRVSEAHRDIQHSAE